MNSLERKRANMLNDIACMLFSTIKISDIIQQNILFNRIDCQLLADYMSRDNAFTDHYSDFECEDFSKAIYDFLRDQDEQGLHVSEHGYIHVFYLLAELLRELLTEQNDVMFCRYTHIMTWRKLTRVTGEEIPVALAYALRDLQAGWSSRQCFTWTLVAPQNNAQLNRMIERGVSEHHYHLWGSAPHFQISWLNLMNNVTNSEYKKNLVKLDAIAQDQSLHDAIDDMVCKTIYGERIRGIQEQTQTFVVMHLQAALIRLFLCARMTENLSVFWPFEYCILGNWKQVRTFIRLCLNDTNYLLMHSHEIQSSIAVLLDMNDTQADYAINLFHGSSVIGQEEYTIFSGERWFMYTVYRDIFSAHSILTTEEQNYFFAYLRIEMEIRRVMLQTNEKIGFDNFQKIQRRKGYFLGDKKSVKRIAQFALREPLKKSPYLLELEARLSPELTAQENYKVISLLDQAVRESNNDCPDDYEDLRKRYYYVFHFLKKKDEALEEIPDTLTAEALVSTAVEYRHYKLRHQIERQTRGIIEFRESYPRTASRVMGIDASSQEIDCRPEVFATVYRFLGKHSSMITETGGKERPLPVLRKTYHVGEDFRDIADGLRAIDEAIRFLDLDCGDRLGHALALGIDADSWYERKNCFITLTQQDYLDNLAWLHHALVRYRIQGMEQLTAHLEERFEYYFRIVYRNYMSDKDQKVIMENAIQCYENDESKRDYKGHVCSFGIKEYYHAWTLRGDHPALYRKGYFDQENIPIDDWEWCMTNHYFPKQFGIRYIPEHSMLNYFYHYNPDVKREGNRKITVRIRDIYIAGIKAVQKAMQFDIADKGIYIEANPTSNVSISTFGIYNKHPMITLYNKGLAHTADELHNCPQINISINTDDKGVFFTDLENEYALMANAVESITNSQGERIYRKSEVLDWLENIRKIGNMQSFRNN